MADKPAKKIRKKNTQTVRERSEQTSNTPKKRTLRKSVRTASTPFRVIGRFIVKIARPFRFLLWPFKTRPMRFIGRIISAIFFLKYFRGAWQEVRQVTWPDRKETRQLTIAVFAFAFVFGLMITVVDYGLDKVFKKVILK